MPTLDDRIHALIIRLTEITEAGGLDWVRMDANRFLTDVPQGSTAVISSAGAGRSGLYPYTLVLRGPDGEEIENIESLGPDEQLGPWDLPLRNLYRAARANALDIDNRIDQMLVDLGVDPTKVESIPDTSDEDIPF